MEITKYEELNALNKLLFKVKFSVDLDFNEFRQFADSDIISDIMNRLNKEYRTETIRLGFLSEEERELKAKPHGEIEKVVLNRLKNLRPDGIEKMNNNGDLEDYIINLFAPFSISSDQLKRIKEFALNLKSQA